MEGTIGLAGLNDRMPSKGKLGSMRNVGDRVLKDARDRSSGRLGEKKRKTQKLTDMYGGPSIRGINNDVVSRRLHGIISSNLQNTLSGNTGTIQQLDNHKSPSNFQPSAISPQPASHSYWQTDFGSKRRPTDIIQNLGELAIRVPPERKMIKIDREAMARMYRETLIKTQLENQQKLAALKQKREQNSKNNLSPQKTQLQKDDASAADSLDQQNLNTRYLRFIKGVENLYQSLAFTIFFAAIIILSLFLRDFWIMTFDASKDGTSDLIIELIFLFFTVESIVNSVIFRQYRFSFVFLLDTISTWTIIIDLTSVPFMSDSDFRQIKGQLAFKIFKLFNVLKLWRATRLFFRKNQTKRFIPINEATIKMNHKSAMEQFAQLKKSQQLKRQRTELIQKVGKSKDRLSFPVLVAGVDQSEQQQLVQKEGNLASFRLQNLQEDPNASEHQGSEINDSYMRSDIDAGSNMEDLPKPRRKSHDVPEGMGLANDTAELKSVDGKLEGVSSNQEKPNKSAFHAQHLNDRAGDKSSPEPGKLASPDLSAGFKTDRSGDLGPQKRRPSNDNIFKVIKASETIDEAKPNEEKQQKVQSIADKFLNEMLERKDSVKKPPNLKPIEIDTLQVKDKSAENELSMAEFIKSLRASDAVAGAPENMGAQTQHRTKAGMIALFKSTVKRFSDNLDHFSKERANYIVRESARQFIFKNKVEAKGNIRKTISYRNVGTIACTVLMANLGLNVFVSSLFLTTNSVCGNDALVLESLITSNLQDPSVSRTDLVRNIDMFYQNTVTKYKKANLEILQFSVGSLFNVTKGTVDQYREEEVTYCTASYTDSSVELGEFEGKIEVLLDNQTQAFVGALLNILRSIFIVVSLLYNVVMTNVDIKKIIMDPIENIFIEVSYI